MKKGLFSKKIWAIVLVTAAILLTVGGTLAIYTSQVYQRAVVRNRYNDVIRFSSDKLLQVAPNTNASEVYYPVAEGQTTLTFNVYNYDQSKSTLVSESDIRYTITFTLSGQDPNFTYQVSCNGGSKELLNSSDHTLQGGKASVDRYTVTFSEKDYRALKLTVTVTPDQASMAITRNTILTATLIPIKYGTTQTFQAKREFPDSLRKNEDNSPFTPTDLDAYNVLVTVTGGEGNVYIRWDHTKVEIDRFFLVDKGITDENITKVGDTSLVILTMNSADDTASCLIPFYNANSTNTQWADWSSLANCITVDTK